MGTLAEEYIVVETSTDPFDIEDEIYTNMDLTFPGWAPAIGSLSTALIQEFSREIADAKDIASMVQRAIFRWFGATVMGLPPIDDESAGTTVTITVKDNTGWTVQEGTQFSLKADTGESVTFQLDDDAVVPPLSTSLAGCSITAVDAGTVGNTLTGTMTVQDANDYIVSVVTDDPTEGGLDAETDDEYLARLKAELQLQSPRPILVEDFAVLARRITGVERATAINGYNPGDLSSGNPLMVAIAAHDADGAAVSAGVKTDIEELLEAMREQNFVVNTMDPTFTDVDFDFIIELDEGYTQAEATLNLKAAVNAFCNPLTWGTPTAGVGEVTNIWNNSTVMRLYDVVNIALNTGGVKRLSSVEIGIHGGATTAADLTLSGVVALPTTDDGNITVTYI